MPTAALPSPRAARLRRPRAIVIGAGSILAITIVSVIFPAVELSNDHFIYLARAFLRGELHVDAIPTHNPDLVDWQGHRYVPFGPFPAVLLVPFLPLLGAGMSVVWVPFGYWYALDFMPFLIILAGLGFPAPLPRQVKWLVMGGVAVNIWGALILLTTFHF